MKWIGSSPYCGAANSSPLAARSSTAHRNFWPGHDPDNLPLVFVCYTKDKPLQSDYYRAVAEQAYSLDV